VGQQSQLTLDMFSQVHELSNRTWIALSSHRSSLLSETEKLFPFFEQRIIDPLGGFYDLDDEGWADSARLRPTSPPGYLFATSRIIHAYAVVYLTGRPGADLSIDHGINFLWNWPPRLRVRGVPIGVSAMMGHRIAGVAASNML
jgi:hypothetical protein